MLSKRFVLTALLLAGPAIPLACSPPDIVPVGPPGIEYVPPTVIAEEDQAQALGEQRTAVALNNANKPRNVERQPLDIRIPPAPATKPGESKKTEGNVTYTTLKPGAGVEAIYGKTVFVHYRGTLEDGKEFDSSYSHSSPFNFVIGKSEVISGWEEGVCGMKVGEKRKLVIPPNMAYGPSGRPPRIPPNATLTFEIELLEVR